MTHEQKRPPEYETEKVEVSELRREKWWSGELGRRNDGEGEGARKGVMVEMCELGWGKGE